MKKITIIPAAGGAYSDLDIQPGTTPKDIKAQLGLADDYVLTRGKDAEPLADGENLYETVTDGTKLFSTTPIEWGK